MSEIEAHCNVEPIFERLKERVVAMIEKSKTDPEIKFRLMMTIFEHFPDIVSDIGRDNCLAIIGNFYYEGIGVKQNKPLGLEWMAEAAKLGHMDSIERLGCEFLENREYEDAYLLLSTSAQAGNMGSQYMLALMWNFGVGVQRHKGKALYWCDLAEKNGHPDAKELRDEIDNVVQIKGGKK